MQRLACDAGPCRWKLSLSQMINTATGRCLTWVHIDKPVAVLPCAYSPNQSWHFGLQYQRQKPAQH